jgi:hypothetical protein
VLVLGILALLCIPIIFGPIAWIMGNSDLRAMREGRMDPDGEGTTKAGMICGIVATCLGLLGCLVWAVMFAAAAAGKGF